jgi:hypothetical protein
MITISGTMQTMQHHGLVDIGHHFERFTLAATTWLTVQFYTKMSYGTAMTV